MSASWSGSDRLVSGLIWQAASLRLRLLGPSVDFSGVYVSAVVRPPAALAATLASIAEDLRAADRTHHVYPPASIHVTVLGLNPWWGTEQTLDTVRGLLAETPPFSVLFHGLNVSPSTVFVQVAAAADIARLRHALSARLGPTRTRRRLRTFALRSLGLVYANLIRFRGPVSRRLLERVKTLRGRDFGTFTVDAVEVLRTDKVLSADATELITHVLLEGRG